MAAAFWPPTPSRAPSNGAPNRLPCSADRFHWDKTLKWALRSQFEFASRGYVSGSSPPSLSLSQLNTSTLACRRTGPRRFVSIIIVIISTIHIQLRVLSTVPGLLLNLCLVPSARCSGGSNGDVGRPNMIITSTPRQEPERRRQQQQEQLQEARRAPDRPKAKLCWETLRRR